MAISIPRASMAVRLTLGSQGILPTGVLHPTSIFFLALSRLGGKK